MASTPSKFIALKSGWAFNTVENAGPVFTSPPEKYKSGMFSSKALALMRSTRVFELLNHIHHLDFLGCGRGGHYRKGR